MRMQHGLRQIDDVAVLDLSGPISPGDTIEDRLALNELVLEQVRNGRKKVVLNLREVTFIDSAGVGDLLGALHAVQNYGGQLLLCCPSERIADLLRRTHLDDVIKCLPDEPSALKAFSATGRGKPSAA